jgi:hypothetical protein
MSAPDKFEDRLLHFVYRMGHIKGLLPLPTDTSPDDVIQNFADFTAKLVAEFKRGFSDGQEDAPDDVREARAAMERHRIEEPLSSVVRRYP